MPTALRVVIAINLVATVLIGLVAWFAGGFVSPMPPREGPAELRLVPVSIVQRAVPSASVVPTPVVSSSSTPEPIAPRWRVGPDGTVRFAPEIPAAGTRP